MKKHILLIILSLFTYTFIGSIPHCNVTMNYVSWFIVLYFISSFVRLYPNNIFNNTKIWGALACCSIIVSAASVFVALKFNNAYYFIVDSNKLLAVVTALCCFMFFKNIKIPYNKFINVVASSTFGVLLIHANSDAMRTWLWRNVLNNVGMFNSPYLYIHAFASVIGIFAVCVIIDQIRIRLIEKPFFVLWDKHFPSICDKCRKFGKQMIHKFSSK